MGRTEYGIIATFNGEDREPQQLRYEIDIQSGEIIDDKYLMYSINKYNIHINDRPPETAVDELGVACGNSFYPVLIGINPQGAIQKLFNFGAIHERWQTVKEQLQSEYAGEMAEWYIRKTGDTISQKSQILQAIRQELFLAFYFLPIQLKYPPGHTQPKYISIPIVPYTHPVQYCLDPQEVDRSVPGTGFDLTLTGHVDDPRSGADLIAGLPTSSPSSDQPPAEGKLKLRYRIAPPRGTKKAITAEASIELPDGNSHSIQIEAYTITNETPSS